MKTILMIIGFLIVQENQMMKSWICNQYDAPEKLCVNE